KSSQASSPTRTRSPRRSLRNAAGDKGNVSIKVPVAEMAASTRRMAEAEMARSSARLPSTVRSAGTVTQAGWQAANPAEGMTDRSSESNRKVESDPTYARLGELLGGDRASRRCRQCERASTPHHRGNRDSAGSPGYCRRRASRRAVRALSDLRRIDGHLASGWIPARPGGRFHRDYISFR